MSELFNWVTIITAFELHWISGVLLVASQPHLRITVFHLFRVLLFALRPLCKSSTQNLPQGILSIYSHQLPQLCSLILRNHVPEQTPYLMVRIII